MMEKRIMVIIVGVNRFTLNGTGVNGPYFHISLLPISPHPIICERGEF